MATAPAAAQAANLNTRKIAATIAGATNAPATAFPTSTGTTVAAFTGLTMTLATPVVSKKSTIATGVKLVVSLPSWALTGTAAPADTCGGVTFTAAVAGTGEANAAITYTVANGPLAAGTACSV